MRIDQGSINHGSSKGFGRLATAVLLALGIAAPVQAKNFVVCNAGDSGPGTLRQAVLDANARPGPHTISFALPPGRTIRLTSGQIAFTGPNVTIRGPGRDRLIVSGNHHSRIFDVEAGRLTLTDLTLRDGLAKGDATNLYDQAGGAIRVGALPQPMASGQFAKTMAAAHNAALTSARNGQLQRASHSAGLMAIRQMQALQPQALQSQTTSTLALTMDRVAMINNRAEAPDISVGGAIYLEGGANLVVRESLFRGNSTQFAGGAILTAGSSDLSTPIGAGSFDIQRSLFIGNHIDQNGAEAGQGAAILTFGPGGRISTSVFRDNVINDPPSDQDFSEGLGGALALLLSDLPIRIDGTEISHNTIALRPGVFSEGAGFYCEQDIAGGTTPLTVTNSTLSNNQSEHGAAIEAGCNLQLFNTTIADNISPNTNGDGDAAEMIFAEGLFNARSTLIANPHAHVDLFLFRGAASLGAVSSSLILAPDPSTPPLPSDTIVGMDPLLAPLAHNGAPTRTQALRAGSVAIDAGSNRQHLRFDQRGPGFPRVIGRAADIGAFEFCPSRDSDCEHEPPEDNTRTPAPPR